MDTTIRNTLIAGIAVLIFATSYIYMQIERGQATSDAARNLGLSTLLETPGQFDSREVSVAGSLLWHADEPTLFVDESALRNLDFGRSIQLEMSSGMDFPVADRKSVIVSGKFFFGAEGDRRLQGYKGVFRVDSISIAGVSNP